MSYTKEDAVRDWAKDTAAMFKATDRLRQAAIMDGLTELGIAAINPKEPAHSTRSFFLVIPTEAEVAKYGGPNAQQIITSMGHCPNCNASIPVIFPPGTKFSGHYHA